jgi:hypothetical protein
LIQLSTVTDFKVLFFLVVVDEIGFFFMDFGVVAAGLAVMISRSSSKFGDETSADTRISGPSLGAVFRVDRH